MNDEQIEELFGIGSYKKAKISKSRLFYTLGAIWSLLNLADFVTTRIALANGAVELNPLIASLSTTNMILYKLAYAPMVMLGISYLIYKMPGAGRYRWLGWAGPLAIVIAWYSYVVANNVHVILQLGVLQ